MAKFTKGIIEYRMLQNLSRGLLAYRQHTAQGLGISKGDVSSEKDGTPEEKPAFWFLNMINETCCVLCFVVQ